jgi:3',5'-cyclic AMP phosphodiesterase CpdA
MRKIIHLSDLHVGYRDCADRLACVVGNLIFAKEPASQYVVLITGDLVESALKERSRAEVKRHVETIRQAGFTVLVAPGNHDYGTGDLGYKRYVPIFKQTFFGDVGVEYPKVDVIEGVAFIALDSMAEELNWHDRLFAQGELGRHQLERLDGCLTAPQVAACTHRVIYLHHHPFDPRILHELKDSAALGEILRGRGNVDALLYGHNHEGKKRNGKWGIARCYDAGSSTRKQHAAGFHRVIDLSRDARLDYDADMHGNY